MSNGGVKLALAIAGGIALITGLGQFLLHSDGKAPGNTDMSVPANPSVLARAAGVLFIAAIVTVVILVVSVLVRLVLRKCRS